MKLTLFVVFLLLQILDVFAVSTLQDRTVKIKNVTLSVYNKKNKTDLIRLEDGVRGKVQFFPLSKYWKFNFVEASKELKMDNALLDKIFSQEIGNYTTHKDNKGLQSMILIKPSEKKPQFEHSMLLNNCYRIDIYPDANNDKIWLNFNFCVANYKECDKINRYRHLLEDKELGKKIFE